MALHTRARARAMLRMSLFDKFSRYQISRFRADPRKQRKLISSKFPRYTVFLIRPKTEQMVKEMLKTEVIEGQIARGPALWLCEKEG